MAVCSLVTGDEEMEPLEEREFDVINASVCHGYTKDNFRVERLLSLMGRLFDGEYQIQTFHLYFSEDCYGNVILTA